MIFCIFYQVSNLFLHPVLFKKPTPSQISFIKNAKNNFLLLKNVKNTESAQLCPELEMVDFGTHYCDP